MVAPGVQDFLQAQDITGAMWDSWGRGDLDLLKSMGVNTFLGEIGETCGKEMIGPIGMQWNAMECTMIHGLHVITLQLHYLGSCQG